MNALALPCRTEILPTIRDISLVTVRRRGLFNSPEFTAHLLTLAGNLSIPVLMISQSSAEGNLCLVIPRRDDQLLLSKLYDDLRTEPATITLTLANDVIVLNVMTQGGQFDGLACLFATLESAGIEVLASSCGIRQGGVSIVIPGTQEWQAVAALRHMG